MSYERDLIHSPFKEENKISEYLISIPKNNQSYIKVYTSIDRIISIGNLVDNSDFSFSFQFENKDHLKKLQLNISISFVEAIENGESIRGMRNCIVKEINLENGIVHFESVLKFI